MIHFTELYYKFQTSIISKNFHFRFNYDVFKLRCHTKIGLT